MKLPCGAERREKEGAMEIWRYGDMARSEAFEENGIKPPCLGLSRGRACGRGDACDVGQMVQKKV